MGIEVDPEHLESLKNLEPKKKELLIDVSCKFNQAVTKIQTDRAINKILGMNSTPKECEIKYPGATCKKYEIVTLNEELVRKKDNFKSFMLKDKVKIEKKSNIYSSSVSILELKKKQGFFRDSGFNCEGVYQ